MRKLESQGYLTARMGSDGAYLFNDAEVARLAESAARTGRVLPATKWAASRCTEVSPHTSSRSARIVELEERERDLSEELERVRSCVTDAVEDLLDVIDRRNRAALDALEQLLREVGP